MKQMKIVARIVTGIIGTIALTSFLLFALDAYLAGQAALPDTNSADKTSAGSLDAALAENTQEDDLSIGASERHMLYQPQEPSSSQPANAAAEYAPASDGKTDIDPSSSGQDTQDNNRKALDQEALSDSNTTSNSDQKTQDGKEIQDDNVKQDNTVKQDSKKKQTDKKKQDTKSSASKDGQASDKKSLTFQTVTEDYFSDALFIGDSRTVGMMQSQLLPASCYYAKTGIGIGDILSERIVNEGGAMISVSDALCRHSFGKVYIMIGINDISCGDVDWFVKQYENILDTIARTQPDAIVYIQSNIPMSYGTQDLSGSLNNRNLALRNEASSALADSKTIFYLDISEIYADANGNLASLYTRDGLHITSNYYALWVDYLLHHAIVRE
ncbi:MAG: hypothetical protein K2N87_03500 [Eubacterium sp.]|nr:hypothetical protein [Eubacterium sp.]